jgi:hypothetical protein
MTNVQMFTTRYTNSLQTAMKVPMGKLILKACIMKELRALAERAIVSTAVYTVTPR